MKKFIPIIVVLVLLFLWINPAGKYNKMVNLDEGVKTEWGQVENQYQRRMDLIPNLEATVKGAADFEKDTLTQVIEARANATKTNINVQDAAEFAEFQKQQTGISSAMSRLMVVMEKYPTLTATKEFGEFRVQLEGTENRISTARDRYNETAKLYNVYVRQFPNNIWAGMFGFARAQIFESAPEAAEAPSVDFSSEDE